MSCFIFYEALLILLFQISSIRKSKSDDKKLYIFTGTKTLHLRAENREDRSVWLDSLQAAKDLFPKIPIAHGLILPFEEITISTTKLRSHLTEAGLSRKLVEDCEEIMMSEFMELQEQLKALQQNHITLIDRLRLLEVRILLHSSYFSFCHAVLPSRVKRQGSIWTS